MIDYIRFLNKSEWDLKGDERKNVQVYIWKVISLNLWVGF